MWYLVKYRTHLHGLVLC